MRGAIAILVTLMACAGDDDGGAIACPEEAEACGYRDGGWDAYCEAGIVWMRSYNTTLYCRPNVSSEVLCESEPPPDTTVHTCAAACATTDRRYLETVDEYNRFDPATLCQ
jgi:hypothetical protein